MLHWEWGKGWERSDWGGGSVMRTQRKRFANKGAEIRKRVADKGAERVASRKAGGEA